ncbi:hypothetical protein BWI93_04540 [Siphonobacter sp. BAB-5385]|uniref:hypothetical protein n=1 Tax=Siphonobacter sp. BAB-5385 TaxID=1864822 RepID=UPI000B9E0633|nr:hypothetical protein [Siphonobacter sp. BAB-5385]OZI09332.1 hypothetical protein BWI93_04540 [Siphonobacter sp. BAB-5385]
MPFEKGKPKTGGRKPGALNKTTADIKARIKTFIDQKFEDISAAIELMEPKDQVAAYLKFMEYILPKQRETKLDISSLSEEELDELLGRAMNKVEEQEPDEE